MYFLNTKFWKMVYNHILSRARFRTQDKNPSQNEQPTPLWGSASFQIWLNIPAFWIMSHADTFDPLMTMIRQTQTFV